MAKNMSMSMMVDRRAARTEWTIRPSTPVTWIPNERVKRCFGCNAQFSTFRRKHHCRSCGRIFCSACSSYREIIPSYYFRFSSSLPSVPQRTCARCADQLKRTARVENIIRMMACIPVSQSSLFKLRLVDKQWNYAINTLLSLIRGLQYKLPCHKYSSVECDFLWSHQKEFNGHMPWVIHTLASLRQRKTLNQRIGHFKSNEHKISCRQLMCSRICCSTLSVNDIIHLGTSGCLSNKKIQKWVIASWNLLPPIVHIKMMFWWVYLGCQYKKLFTDGLIPLCRQSLALVYALWFECELQKIPNFLQLLSSAQQTLEANISRDDLNELKISIDFINHLKLISCSNTEKKSHAISNEFFQKYSRVILPWNVNQCVTGIISIRQLTSSSKPLLIHCASQQKNIKILLKKEDVRTDRLAMVIGYWINVIATDIHVHTYDVFPISTTCGVVEIIQNTKTLYDIRSEGQTLLNFILQNNENEPIKTVRQRTISSCSGACLLAFTMGLGDRHLENIMATKNAELVHVDFGWVFGDDPKMSRTPMRITNGMIEAMGGRNSVHFNAFVHLTKQGYQTMRLHTSFWYQLLSTEYFIARNANRSWKRIRDHVMDRFVPGEWSEEASVQIQSVVNEASQSSWFQSLADFTHLASNKVTDIFHIEL